MCGVSNLLAAILPTLKDEGLVIFEDAIALKELFETEQKCAKLLQILQTAPAEKRIQEQVALLSIDPQAYAPTGMTLSVDQKDAIRLALKEQVCIITGGPGTGKTTILKVLLDILEHHSISYTLCAPTGKAAIRMKETTGRESATIHRTLGLFAQNGPYDVLTNYLVVDEVSMVDGGLLYHVLRALHAGQRLVLIGDVDQLPPVGAGEPFYQLILVGTPTARLNVIHRQGKNSGIVAAAHAINEGRIPEADSFDDFKLGIAGGNAQLPTNLMWMLERVMGKYNFTFDDIQVLTPVNDNPWGRKALNKILQERYNPGPFPLPGVQFKLGDRVIHLHNNYDLGVMNGEIGEVVWITPAILGQRKTNEDLWDDEDKEDPTLLLVRFRDHSGNTKYNHNTLLQLDLAYSLTIHKAQGSEYPAVIMLVPLVWKQFALRQLPYTGLTRAKKYALMLCANDALKHYVENEERIRRYTLLARLIGKERTLCSTTGAS
jgi:exodeoxyribonuclease V alpha subunit